MAQWDFPSLRFTSGYLLLSFLDACARFSRLIARYPLRDFPRFSRGNKFRQSRRLRGEKRWEQRPDEFRGFGRYEIYAGQEMAFVSTSIYLWRGEAWRGTQRGGPLSSLFDQSYPRLQITMFSALLPGRVTKQEPRRGIELPWNSDAKTRNDTRLARPSKLFRNAANGLFSAPWYFQIEFPFVPVRRQALR